MIYYLFVTHHSIGFPSSLVAHIVNYEVEPFKVFAEATVYTNGIDGKREVVYMSNGIWRGGCRFELFFGPMMCNRPNEVLYLSV